MGIGYALGTGFLSRAVKEQEDNKDEARSNRQLAMKVWMTDTLPKVQAARAADTQAVSQMNSLFADDYFKGNPGLAFMATKGIQNGTYKNVDAFKMDVDSGKINLPPDVQAAQRAELDKYFNLNTDETGRVTGAALKPEPPVTPGNMPAMPGADKQPGFFDRMMGKTNPAQDMQEQRGTFSGMTGIDPLNASITPRTQNINLPGASVPTVDPRKEAFQKEATDFIKRNPDLIKNPNLFADKLASGDLDGAIKAGQMFTAKDIRNENYNNQYRLKVMEMIPEMKDGSAVLGAIFSPKFDRDKLGGILKGQFKSEDEKIAYLTKLETAKQRIAGLDDPQKILLLDAQDLLHPLLPDSADYNKFVAEAKKQYTDKVNAMNAYTGRILNNNGDVLPGAINPPPPGAANPAVQTPATTATQDATNPPAATAKKPPVSPWTDPEGASTGVTYGDKVSTSTGPVGGEGPVRAKPRIGEDNNLMPAQDGKLHDLVTKEPPVKVREANPFSVIKSMKTISDTTRKAEVAKNITFTEADAKRFFSEGYSDNASALDRDVTPYLKEYKSSAEAAKEVEVGQLFKSEGKVSIMTPGLKSKANQ